MKNRYIILLCALFPIKTCISASQDVLDTDIKITSCAHRVIRQCAEDVDKKNFSAAATKQTGVECEKIRRVKEPWYRVLEGICFFMTRAPLPLPTYDLCERSHSFIHRHEYK